MPLQLPGNIDFRHFHPESFLSGRWQPRPDGQALDFPACGRDDARLSRRRSGPAHPRFRPGETTGDRPMKINKVALGLILAAAAAFMYISIIVKMS
ncbi:MAG: hypothetical protein KDE22_17675 [Rhodobacterales bacterium]|nr:hypothetical protein [Rhodobacterales bacterium]